MKAIIIILRLIDVEILHIRITLLEDLMYEPKKSDHFTFGLWTVGNIGRDPFGDPVRSPFSPEHIVENLSRLGAYGVNLHDNDLVPFGASSAEHDRIVKSFKSALEDHGMKVPMATTNLFTHPVFKEGAFTSNDPDVREFALKKTLRAIDLGADLGAGIYVFWGGREGSEVDASKQLPDGYKYFRDALNFLCSYVNDQGYDMKFALEAKPNEPRGHLFLPTTGAMLGFIATLDQPDMVGVNPEVAHETMAGLNFPHAVAQAIDAQKLFHVDLNDQEMNRFDQDFRFGSVQLKSNFFLVKLLEDIGYDGMRHFDAHAYRTEQEDGVWEFARGCMRTYLILREKADRFNGDPEIQGMLSELHTESANWDSIVAGYTSDKAAQLQAKDFDVDAMAKRDFMYEKLDQLTVEIILGIR